MHTFWKNKFSFFSVLLLAFAVSGWAGSINLVNDTIYTLRALIRGDDGTYLGEVVLSPEYSIRWTDTYGQIGAFGEGSIYREHSTRSQTPYKVMWYCTNGQDFSVNHNVPTGMSVYATRGEGRKICAEEKEESSP